MIEVKGTMTRERGPLREEECRVPREEGSMRRQEGPMHRQRGSLLEIECPLLVQRGTLLEVEGTVRKVNVRQRPYDGRPTRIIGRPLDPFYPQVR
jgi:hypothetical protein